MKKVLWAISGFLIVATAQAASFDCSKAGTKVEKMVCSSPTISALDDKLHGEYVKALAQACDAAELKTNQKQWLMLRDKSKDEKELSSMYEQKINWLRSKVLSPQVQYSVINPRMGRYKFEMVRGQCIEYRSYPNQEYTVTISNPVGKRLQEIKIQSSFQPGNILYINDIDGDGYKDLLFQVGIGHGPFPFVALYRYHPHEKQFVLDESFPSEGGITASKHKGCVNVEERFSSGTDGGYDYATSELCLSADTGEWNEVVDCGNSDKTACQRE